MKVIGIAWYLCCLLFAAAVIESMITYAPEAERMGLIIGGTLLVLAVVFGMGAMGLTIYKRRCPASRMFNSKPLFMGIASFAVVLTIVILLGIVG
jgi:hypothetical protein